MRSALILALLAGCLWGRRADQSRGRKGDARGRASQGWLDGHSLCQRPEWLPVGAAPKGGDSRATVSGDQDGHSLRLGGNGFIIISLLVEHDSCPMTCTRGIWMGAHSVRQSPDILIVTTICQ